MLRDQLFNRKSEQTADRNTSQLAMFNEPERKPLLAVVDDADKESVAERVAASAITHDLSCRISRTEKSSSIKVFVVSYGITL